MPTTAVLPNIGPINRSAATVPNNQGRVGEDGNRRVIGEDYKFNPGIQDNDTITNPEVASRLIWATILP